MSNPGHSRVIHWAEARAVIPGPDGQRSISLLQHGSLDVLLSHPLPPNTLKTHEQNEVYMIIRGRGVLLHGGERESFAAGDCIFIPAGTAHRFEEFSEDLAVWVIFYGPPGGEPSQSH